MGSVYQVHGGDLSTKFAAWAQQDVGKTIMQPFHLAFPVDDLAAADAFYGDLLGCERGRRSDQWIDFNFHGHQIVAHLAPEECAAANALNARNGVDGDAVPVRHFGLIMDRTAWRELADKLTQANTEFIIPPRIRFEGEPGEQGTFFVRDPAGNALEFKCFADLEQVFAID